MYARNISSFLLHIVKDGKLRLDKADEIMRDTLLTVDGEIVNQRLREFYVAARFGQRAVSGQETMKMDLLTSLYVFMLAGFIGFEVIRNITPLLHTPLMSLDQRSRRHRRGRRDYSGRRASTARSPPCLGTIAIVAATSNVVGGFLITDRMLKMFKASGPKK